MSLVWNLHNFSKSHDIPFSTILKPAMEEVIQEITQVTDIYVAIDNHNLLFRTEIDGIAFDVLARLQYEKHIKEKSSVAVICKFRQTLSVKHVLRSSVNDLIISRIDSASELYHAANNSEGLLHGEKYSPSVFRSRMDELCLDDIKKTKTAAGICNILDTFLDPGSGEVFGQGISMFVKFVSRETKAADNTGRLRSIDKLLILKEPYINKKTYRRLKRALINKCVALCKSSMSSLYERTALERMMTLKSLYLNLEYIDTSGSSELLPEIRAQFHELCNAILVLASTSKEARSVELALKVSSNSGLFDDKLATKAQLINEKISAREVRNLLDSHPEQMSQYIDANLNEYGDPGCYNNSWKIVDYYKKHFDAAVADKNIFLITLIKDSIPSGFRSECKRSLFEYASDLVDGFNLEKVLSSNNINEIEQLIDESRPDSELCNVGKRRIEELIIEKLNALDDIESIGTEIDRKYMTPAVMDAIAAKAFKYYSDIPEI